MCDDTLQLNLQEKVDETVLKQNEIDPLLIESSLSKKRKKLDLQEQVGNNEPILK